MDRYGDSHIIESLGQNVCNAKNPLWQVDTGIFDEKTLLPITGITYEGVEFEGQKTRIKVGPLTCLPNENQYDLRQHLETIEQKADETIEDITAFEIKLDILEQNNTKQNEIINKLEFTLTKDQKKTLEEIHNDLYSTNKMFRLLQGDVGSGKTIVSLIAAYNTINSGFQVAVMAPTEILARQHYNFAKKLFSKKVNVELISGKSEYKTKKEILKKLANNEIDIIFGTHAIFQKKVNFNNLGLIIIDEQHKFGVNQRKRLSDKGGNNCDVLLMTATPIPRTLTMTLYGDMDLSIIREKPKSRKPIKTYSKLESKIDDVVKFIKKELKFGNQVFWVCPLIEESKKLDHSSAVKKYDYLNKLFPNQVSLLHGKTDLTDKEIILDNFLKNKFQILVSTTIIEVGIDFPNANVIIIENANKFGLSQLHQLRGRVGRGSKESTCILMFKSNLSENAKKRINILKESRSICASLKG